MRFDYVSKGSSEGRGGENILMQLVWCLATPTNRWDNNTIHVDQEDQWRH